MCASEVRATSQEANVEAHALLMQHPLHVRVMHVHLILEMGTNACISALALRWHHKRLREWMQLRVQLLSHRLRERMWLCERLRKRLRLCKQLWLRKLLLCRLLLRLRRCGRQRPRRLRRGGRQGSLRSE